MMELVVVMSLLVILAAVSAPRLAEFFRGRGVDNEARRLWALTERARSESLALGLPTVVWADADTGEYGLAAGPGLGAALTPTTYTLPDFLVLETTGDLAWWPDGSLSAASDNTWRLYDTRRPDQVWLLGTDLDTGTCVLTREVTP